MSVETTEWRRKSDDFESSTTELFVLSCNHVIEIIQHHDDTPTKGKRYIEKTFSTIPTSTGGR